MAATNYVEQRTVDFWLRGGAEFGTTEPTTVYAALFTSSTTDAGGGTELSGNGYARQSVTFSAMTGATDGNTTNQADIEFPQATDDWGTITHLAIYDASSSGNMLYHGQLNTSKLIENGDVFKILTDDLSVTLS